MATIFGIIIQLIFGIWLSSEASNDGRGKVKWFFFGFFFGMFAVAVYYIRKYLFYW